MSSTPSEITLSEGDNRQELTRKRRPEEDSCESEAKRERPTSTGFDLDNLGDFYVKMIVRKLKLVSVVRFIQSCRRAENIVNDSKAGWEIEYLTYSDDSRTICPPWEDPENDEPCNFNAEKFCSVRDVEIADCTPTYMKEVVVPELDVLRAVGTLNICLLHNASREDLCLVLAAAKPDRLKIWEKQYYNQWPGLFENMKNLEMTAMSTVQSYWTIKIFELARNRMTLQLNFRKFHKEVIEIFIANWQRGESTGTLEKLMFWMDKQNETVDADAIRADIENMLTSFVSTPDGYILGRRDRRQIRLNFTVWEARPEIMIQFL